jgi:serine O-acetyltransferase
VGSNSVVLKSVPAGATAVGIPAHIVDPNSRAAAERDKIAYKMGFHAYGATTDVPDPIAYAINHMLDHIHEMDGQIETLKNALHDAGIQYPESSISKLHGCEIDDG